MSQRSYLAKGWPETANGGNAPSACPCSRDLSRTPRKIQQRGAGSWFFLQTLMRVLGAYLLRQSLVDMSLLRLLESWTEGLVRICIGFGLFWIGWVEGGGYGVFLEVVGGIFIAAGVGEIWAVEAAALRPLRRKKP